jgi:cephalosporin-C deacetylase-like acetyl esterase
MRPLFTLLAVAALLAPAVAGPAQSEDLAVLKPGAKGTPPQKMLYEYLRGEAQKALDARRKAVAALKTPDDVRRRQQELRSKFIEAIGGFPEKTPLNPQVVGTDKRDGYRIERIIYESRPNHHVTANLYLPAGKGPFPGVLMPMGHSSNGKAAAEAQRGAVLLAQNGLATLVYDPIGQGERRQLLDDKGKPAIASSTNEHTLTGVGALLVAQSTAGYRIWDGIRSLDYLCSRPEIDARRIGCTGSSGGGTLTSYLMALDDRIIAAAPSCYITSLERLFATIGPQDAEQNITGQVAFGMDHADYLLLHAPRPTLICAATGDFFDIQGTWDTYREASRIYGILGHPERVHLVEFDTKHGFPRPQREAVVQWMRRWLLDKDEAPPHEGDIAVAKDEALQCTRSGQVLEDFKGKSVFHLSAERGKELASKRAARLATLKTPELLKEVRRLLGVPDKVAALEPRELGLVQRGAKGEHLYSLHKLLFEPEGGFPVPVLGGLTDYTEKVKAVILYLHEGGAAADAQPGGPIERLIKAGNWVLALDLRGLGETAPGVPKAKSYFGADVKEAFLSLHLNRPLLGQRTLDVLTVLEWAAKSRKQEPIQIIAIGAAGPVALHAAALDDRISEVTLQRSLVSWSSVVQTPVNYNQLTNVVPGVLESYDLPDLAGRLAPRPLTISDPLDAAGQLVSATVLDEAYASCRAEYQRQGAGKQLTLRGGR